MQNWRLAWRLLWRDWRAGELHTLFAALVIAVAATSSTGFFTDRLQRGMQQQSSGLLGADLLLRSPRAFTKEWLQEAERLHLKQTRTLEFPSMLVHGEQMQLASILAVDTGFPLRGTVRIRKVPGQAVHPADSLPASGEIWVEERLLHLLEMAMGDSLQLGERELRVSRILEFVPASSQGMAALAPQVLIQHADLQASGVLGSGSRIIHNLLLAGATDALDAYSNWVQDRLENSQQLIDVRKDKPAVGTALQRAERYLSLAGLAAVLLAGVAIAMAARHYSERHFDVSATLRCLGARQNDILMIYLPQMFLLGLGASLIGLAIGLIAQFGLFVLLRELLPMQLPAPGQSPALLGLASGLIVLIGFALPPVLRLRNVPALRVLRRELAPLPLHLRLLYLLATATLGLLLILHTGEPWLTLSILLGSSLALILLGGFAWLLLQLPRGLRQGSGTAWRHGLNQLWHRPWQASGQILAFGLVLMAMALIALLRNELLDNWQQQLPDDTADHFVINILPQDVERFNDFIRQHGIASSRLYPVVRGRLSAVNGHPVQNILPAGDDGGGALNRELNLTWSTQLPDNNRITAGHWWQEAGDKPAISIEDRLAERLGAGLGDKISFSFAGETTIEAEITTLRHVEWSTFQPNFFVIFTPGALDKLPATWMTALHLEASGPAFAVQLAREFPAITLISLQQVLSQIRQIIHQVSLAVEYVLIFVLLAGIVVLYASLQTSLDERLREGALLRTLGASRYQLRSAHLAEFSLLGLLAGLFAALGSELIAALLYSQVFGLPVRLHGALWLALPLSGALLVGITGYLGTRRTVQHSPLNILHKL